MTTSTTISPDNADVWRYARRMCLTMAILSIPVSCIATLATHDNFSLSYMIGLAALIWAGATAYAFLYTCISIFHCGNISYEISNDSLQVRRGEKQLSAWHLSTVHALRMEGYVPSEFHWLALNFFLDWPRLVVESEGEGRFNRHTMPAIMLWGRGAADRAERELRHAWVAYRTQHEPDWRPGPR